MTVKSVQAAAYPAQACALWHVTILARQSGRRSWWSSTKHLLGVMSLVYLLPIVLFLLGYFATGSLSSEGLRYAIAIAAFVIGIIPAIICDRRTKKSGALTFTIVRLF